jgi:integrase
MASGGGLTWQSRRSSGSFQPRKADVIPTRIHPLIPPAISGESLVLCPPIQRIISRDEYDRLHKVIAKRFPEHLAEFVVSVHTGMRLSEQYSCTWPQVDLERRTIELTRTKNGSASTVHLNLDALKAIESLKRRGQKASDSVRTAVLPSCRSDRYPSMRD